MKKTRNIITLSGIAALFCASTALADTGGINSLLQAASAPPANAPAPQHPVAIKGLPLSMQPGTAPKSAPAIPAHHVVLVPHHEASRQPVPSHPGLAKAVTASPAIQHAPAKKPGPDLQATPPVTVQTTAPAATDHTALRLYGNKTGGSHPSAPSMVPARPNPSADMASAGYVNPFTGTPGIVERLTGKLETLKLQNQIAKQQAEAAKLNGEVSEFSISNSPQLREVRNDMMAMQNRIASLESAVTRKQRRTEIAVQKKQEVIHLAGILDNDGQRTAVMRMGHHFVYATAGQAVGSTSITRIGTHSVHLSNGNVLHNAPAIGHYDAVSWGSVQSSGRIASPQSAIAEKLAQEANGAHLPALPGATPPGATQAPQMLNFGRPQMPNQLP
ncbi:hypothetical protein [Acidithiobacillus ferridurans]|uniref:Type IV pilus biogenesis protein PilP n=1 Tax=Acidithiobacillus ferridurans TaxID=1232575 RepID=A0A8X8G9J1_ACIFI|nr:hypothetical protein [Acidithiobacillus ferridurans]MBU2716702.1 hypothetical protein [Acidithiobacillus ferridurans]MBU2723809.1 hypothetical protein [Acidithiobacillus ferridurans]MBU2725430.1 hypothetical protein [Acidithiobacillus ferridurans]